MNESHYIVIDCETGGLEPEKNPITQLALMVLDRYTLKEIDRFETYVKPYKNLKILQEALNASFVKMSDVNKGMDAALLVRTLEALFNQHTTIKGKFKHNGIPVLVGQNIAFDIGMVAKLFSLFGKNLFDYVQRNGIDTWADSKRAYGSKSDVKHKLSITAERLGIELKDAHGAMYDVIATAEIFRKFTQRLRSIELEEEEEGTDKKEAKKIRKRDTFEF